MTIGIMEDAIRRKLDGNARGNALAFAEHLRKSGLQAERGGGYWADKLYWIVRYRGEVVCYVLIDGMEEMRPPWVIWSDDSGSAWFAEVSPDEATRETAWRHVDRCADCGGCSGGVRKVIFGREFARVCRTAFRFDNPDADAVACAKELAEIRKRDIGM